MELLEKQILKEIAKRNHKILVVIAIFSAIFSPGWTLLDYFAAPDTWRQMAVVRIIAALGYLLFFVLLKKEKIAWRPALHGMLLFTTIPIGYILALVPEASLDKYLLSYSVVYVTLAAFIYVTWAEYLFAFGEALFFVVFFNWLTEAHSVGTLIENGTIFMHLGILSVFIAYAKRRALIREIKAKLKNEQLTRELQVANEELFKKNEEIYRQSEFVKELNSQLERQNEELFKKNKDITDSIRVAQRIQEALLRINKNHLENFQEHFIFYKPKDIVSGDFYWSYSSGDEKLLAVADCTGHGVPGSLLSVLGINILQELIKENIKRPDKILNALRERLNKILNPMGSSTILYEGMDI